jgi:hypothetical protein
MSAKVKNSTLAIKKQTDIGTDPVVAATNVIAFKECNIKDTYERIKVEEVLSSYSANPDLQGIESVSGDITFNLKPFTPGSAPETDPLWECGVGAKNSNTASTCGTGSTTTSIVLATGHGAHHAVKDAIVVPCPTATTGTAAGTGQTTTNVNFTSITGFKAGDIIGCSTGASQRGVTRIVSFSGTNATVYPALPAAAQTGSTITKLTLCPTHG